MIKLFLFCFTLLLTSVGVAEPCMSEVAYYRASEMEMERNFSHSTALVFAKNEDTIVRLAKKTQKEQDIPYSFALGHAEAIVLVLLASRDEMKKRCMNPTLCSNWFVERFHLLMLQFR